MEVSLIAAMGRNREIGKDNTLMWRLPNDMKFFKETTEGHHVLMGRKNYESIPEAFRPFKNRVNLVLSRNSDFDAPGCVLFNEIGRAVRYAQDGGESELFIIGGEQIYQLALNGGFVTRIYLTQVAGDFAGAEAHFPAFDETLYTRELLLTQEADDRHAFAFKVFLYTRI